MLMHIARLPHHSFLIGSHENMYEPSICLCFHDGFTSYKELEIDESVIAQPLLSLFNDNGVDNEYGIEDVLIYFSECSIYENGLVETIRERYYAISFKNICKELKQRHLDEMLSFHEDPNLSEEEEREVRKFDHKMSKYKMRMDECKKNVETAFDGYMNDGEGEGTLRHSLRNLIKRVNECVHYYVDSSALKEYGEIGWNHLHNEQSKE